jgi:prephenate dehydrogenase
MIPLARQAARSMRAPGSLLTDVGSTKASLVRGIERALPRGIGFVGSHPIAGSERRGLDAADARLFDGLLCILTPTARTGRRTLAAIKNLWTGLQMKVLTMSPERHDRLLAGGSHLPHLIAYALAGSIQPGLPCIPRSFADMTRIARSEPDLWDDIFLSNRAPVIHAVAAFAHELERLGHAIARGDRAALRRRLARAKRQRDALEED